MARPILPRNMTTTPTVNLNHEQVFADTFYFLALLNRNDQAHGAALQAARECSTPLVTTAWVMVETGDAMSGLKLRGSFARFLTALRDDPAIEVIAAEVQLLEKGLALYNPADRIKNGR